MPFTAPPEHPLECDHALTVVEEEDARHFVLHTGKPCAQEVAHKLGARKRHALVTDLDLPAQEIWRNYRGRADCENRIKELKYDFAADSFCLCDFWATEACFNVALLAYNLMSLFRQAVLKASALRSGGQDIQHTLKTLRYKLFAKAGYTTEGRKDILKLAIAMRQRQWMEGLGDQSKTFSLPVHFTPTFSSA